jgi:hypothetical protein
MKKLIILIPLFFFLTTCGPTYRYKQYRKYNPTPTSKYLNHRSILMDKEIVPIFEEWVRESQKYKTKPNWDNVGFIYFSDTLSEKFAGMQIDYRGIYINNDYKETPYLKVIVYHELGHGMFNLPHDTVGINIMSPYFNKFLAQIYLTNWERYKDNYWNHISITYKPILREEQ